MNDIVSVRMPSTLVKELKTISEKKHYLDVSELVRSIVRKKATTYSSPYTTELKKVVYDLEKEINQKTRREDKETLLLHIQKLIEEANK